MCLSFVVEIQRRESYEVKDVRRPGKMMSSPCILVNLILSYGSKPITAFAIFLLFLHHTDSLQNSVHIKMIIPTTAVYILLLIKTTKLSSFFTCP